MPDRQPLPGVTCPLPALWSAQERSVKLEGILWRIEGLLWDVYEHCEGDMSDDAAALLDEIGKWNK